MRTNKWVQKNSKSYVFKKADGKLVQSIWGTDEMEFTKRDAKRRLRTLKLDGSVTDAEIVKVQFVLEECK